MLFTTKPENFNYNTIIEFELAFLASNPALEEKKYALVMDNAPWHNKIIRLVETETRPEYGRNAADFGKV